MEILFYRIVICLLLFCLLLALAYIFYDKVVSTKAEWLDRFIKYIFSNMPDSFEWSSAGRWLGKVWANNRLHNDIKKQLKDVVDDGFDAELSVQFVQADSVKVQRNRNKLIVMYKPGEQNHENFINATLAYAQNCVPNAKTILDPELKECVTLSLAKKLIESHSAACSHEFSSKYLIGDEENRLAANPYFDAIKSMDEKHFFTRVYLRALMNFGNSFDDGDSTGSELCDVANMLTQKLAEISDAFLIQSTLPNLVSEDDPNLKEGLHFYLNERGMRINLMFVRSEIHFNNKDTAPYVAKSRELVDKGVDLHFVISGGHSIKKISRKDYVDRVNFSKVVARDIRSKVEGLKHKGETSHMIEYNKVYWPIFCAVFVGTKRRTPKLH